MNALEKMRQILREEEERKANQAKPKFKSDGASFPIGSIPDNTTTTIRFIPDADVNNPWFWRERQVCKLVFDGQVGGEYETDEPVEVTVPCMDMWVEPKNYVSACPIIQGTKHLWKDKTNEANIAVARQYYKKCSFLYQGFVVNTQVQEEEIPENPIRRFVIYPSIHKIIRGVLTNAEVEDSPTDYLLGRDFKIKKDKKKTDTWPDYVGSSWSMKVRPLSEIESIAIQEYGPFNLSEFVGTQPDAEGIAVIKAMFEDSFKGKPFDFESYGSFYRAFKVKGGERRVDVDAVTQVQSEPTVQKTVSRPPVQDSEMNSGEDEPVVSGKQSSADVMSRLKAKYANKA